ncbi:unnamed protein product [Alternaria burnsii]|nr:unnamed protein product [Alternaria burnsii]
MPSHRHSTRRAHAHARTRARTCSIRLVDPLRTFSPVADSMSGCSKDHPSACAVSNLSWHLPPAHLPRLKCTAPNHPSPNFFFRARSPSYWPYAQMSRYCCPYGCTTASLRLESPERSELRKSQSGLCRLVSVCHLQPHKNRIAMQ